MNDKDKQKLPLTLKEKDLDALYLEQEKINKHVNGVKEYLDIVEKECKKTSNVVLLLRSISLLLSEYDRVNGLITELFAGNNLSIELLHEIIILTKERKDIVIEVTNHITKLQKVIELFDLHKKDSIFEPDDLSE